MRVCSSALSLLTYLSFVASYCKVVSGHDIPHSSTVVQQHQQKSQYERFTQEVELIKVTKLVLVNTDTGEDIMDIINGTVYDVYQIGTNITIRAETTDTNGCGWVVFDLDNGALQHNDLNRPFSVAGNTTNGQLVPSARLSQVGSHTLRVTPSIDGSLINVPVELEEFPIEVVRTNFKSCWNIKAFTGITSDGEIVVPAQINTTSTIVGETIVPLQQQAVLSESTTTTDRSTGSLSSQIQNFVTKSSASLSSTISSYNPGRYLKQQTRQVQKDDSTSTDFTILDDGSVFVTFQVMNGPRGTIAPTAAPKPSYDVPGYSATAAGTIQGDFEVWNKLTLGFIGPSTSELGSSERGPYGPLGTFKDIRIDVKFVHVDSQKEFLVPGYFALDGDAANSIGKSPEASVWLTHFIPNQAGDWTWSVSFLYGENCAPNGGGTSAGYFDGQQGKFFIDAASADSTTTTDEDMNDKDLLRKGKLLYVGKSQLRFAGNDEYFIKAGPDSPENFLAYSGFDGTNTTTTSNGFMKTYAAHKQDYMEGNPTWSNGNGTGIIGAINYLSSTGVNIFSVTALTIDGTDSNVHPFSDTELSATTTNYDVSKLAQWGIVFDWAERKGLVIKFKFMDSESDSLSSSIFNDIEDRYTFYREMIARFGHHLGLIWDLGEDMSNYDDITMYSQYIRTVDPYGTPIMIQAPRIVQDTVYKKLYGLPTIDIVSVSVQTSTSKDIASTIPSFISDSAVSGRPLAVSTDDAESSNSLWLNILSGGMGSQYYFGATNDLSFQDFRSQRQTLLEAGYALDFISSNLIPLQNMNTTKTINTDQYVAVSFPTMIVVYKRKGEAQLDIKLPGTSSSSYTVSWFNPSNGQSIAGSTVSGNFSSTGSSTVNVGLPPSNPQNEWICLLKST